MSTVFSATQARATTFDCVQWSEDNQIAISLHDEIVILVFDEIAALFHAVGFTWI
jgi:hypothetical protein